MRKQIKVAAVAAAAALLGLGAAMTSFAYGWVEEAGVWHYEDRDGDYVTGTWEKSGDGWYYLDDDGNMALDQLVEYDDNYYYVDANGAMVRNDWRLVEQEDYDEDEEAERWYYFQNNGKAYKNVKKEIKGKTYIFDDEARMLYGWITENYELATEDEAWVDAMYYAGDNMDGAIAKSAWRYIDVVDDNEDESYWFWFQSNGKKFVPEGDKGTKSIKSKTYLFGGAGEMLNEWNTVRNDLPTSDNAAEFGYFAESYELRGDLIKKGWFKTYPGEDFDGKWEIDEEGNRKWKSNENYEDGNDAKEFWFYGGTDGKLYTNCVRTINGKKYLFNKLGEMQTGLKYLTFDAQGNLKNIQNISYAYKNDVSSDEKEQKKCVDYWPAAEGKDGFYYFAGPADTDGSMKTGAVTINLDGTDFAFNFATGGENKGRGISKKLNNAYYINGFKVVADEDLKYEIFKLNDQGVLDSYETYAARDLITSTIDDKGNYKGDKDNFVGKPAADDEAQYVVISSKGVVKTSGSAKDGDDYKLYVKKSHLDGIQIKL